MPLPTRLVLLGHPVAHSRSPAFQGAALRAAGLDIGYSALDVEPLEFSNVVASLKTEGAAGNVTVPYKERMHDLCDDLSPLARRVGAVNTFWTTEDHRLVGDNTDVGGFDRAARTLLGGAPRDLTVGLLGAGGAAAAILAAIEQWSGCVVHVYNRTPERARVLCERFGSFAQPVDDIGVIAGAQLLVNATTIGLRDDSTPIDVSLLSPDTAVLDIIQRAGATRLVREASGRGLRALDGTVMLWEQGALAFERWFGRSPDRAAMWAALSSSPVPS